MLLGNDKGVYFRIYTDLLLIFVFKLNKMLERILPYEKELLFFINGHHYPWLDPIMWILSNTILLVPFAFFLTLLFRDKKDWTRWLPLFFGLAFVFLIGDFFSSTLIKPTIQRFRPTYYPGIQEQIRIVYDYVGKLYGFLSGHATSSIGFATFSALLIRQRGYAWAIYGWAFLVCYSRVYFGVHFISDILAGILLGLAVGLLVYLLYSLYVNKVQKSTLESGKKQAINGLILALFFVLTFVTLRTEGII